MSYNHDVVDHHLRLPPGPFHHPGETLYAVGSLSPPPLPPVLGDHRPVTTDRLCRLGMFPLKGILQCAAFVPGFFTPSNGFGIRPRGSECE